MHFPHLVFPFLNKEGDIGRFPISTCLFYNICTGVSVYSCNCFLIHLEWYSLANVTSFKKWIILVIQAKLVLKSSTYICDNISFGISEKSCKVLSLSVKALHFLFLFLFLNIRNLRINNVFTSPRAR